MRAGWATPRVSDQAAGRRLTPDGKRESASGLYGANLSDQVTQVGQGGPVAGWQTPKVADADGGQTSRGGRRKNELLLGGEARSVIGGPAAGWPTPTSLVDNVAHTPERWAKRAAEQAKKGVNLEKPLGTVAGMAQPSPQADPDLFPLCAPTPGRVGRLRAYGNAINPHVAAVFIRAFLESNT